MIRLDDDGLPGFSSNLCYFHRLLFWDEARDVQGTTGFYTIPVVQFVADDIPTEDGGLKELGWPTPKANLTSCYPRVVPICVFSPKKLW
jgi:hypothetical protein